MWFEFRTVMSSFMTRFHSRGDKMPPCGHPFPIDLVIVWFKWLTIMVLWLIRLLINVISGCGTQWLPNADTMASGVVWSKAPCMSRNVQRVLLLAASEPSSFDTKVWRAVSVDLSAVNACWFGWIGWEGSTIVLMWCSTNLSNVLSRKQVRLIGLNDFD